MKKDKKEEAAEFVEIEAVEQTIETETVETETVEAEETEIEAEAEAEIQIQSESEAEKPAANELFPAEETQQEEIPVKGKRGRKAGGKNKPKETEEIKEEKTESEKTEEEIKKQIFGNKKEEKKEENKKEAAAEPPKQLFAVSGEMLLGAIDFTLPLIITQAGGFFDKDIKKISVETLQLHETEKKALMPAAEAVAKENIRLTAMEMLLSGLLIIYTGKIYQAVKEIKQNK
jgi:hypothetical protein